MAYTNPTVSDFKNQFVRDFPYGVDINNDVLDSDITYAFQFTNAQITNALFPDQGTYALGYNLLAAHFLVTNLRASSQGINGQYDWLQNQKSVGPVSESFTIPDRIPQNAFWSSLSKTNYGQNYLSLVLPKLTAPAFAVYGPPRAL